MNPNMVLQKHPTLESLGLQIAPVPYLGEVTAPSVGAYYRARGARHASVSLVAEGEVSGALRAVEAALVRSRGRKVVALTQEATRLRWQRAGSMLLLRHRAYAAAAAGPFGVNYTHVRAKGAP